MIFYISKIHNFLYLTLIVQYYMSNLPKVHHIISTNNKHKIRRHHYKDRIFHLSIILLRIRVYQSEQFLLFQLSIILLRIRVYQSEQFLLFQLTFTLFRIWVYQVFRFLVQTPSLLHNIFYRTPYRSRF